MSLTRAPRRFTVMVNPSRSAKEEVDCCVYWIGLKVVGRVCKVPGLRKTHIPNGLRMYFETSTLRGCRGSFGGCVRPVVITTLCDDFVIHSSLQSSQIDLLSISLILYTFLTAISPTTSHVYEHPRPVGHSWHHHPSPHSRYPRRISAFLLTPQEEATSSNR